MAQTLNKNVFALGVATAALFATGAALGGSTASTHLAAKMSAGQVAPNKPKGNLVHATGTLNGTLSGKGTRWKLRWRVTYKRLDHPSLVIADIHYGKPGKFGPVIVRLCGPCKSGQHGVKKIKSLWVDAIERGNSFITLITGKNPNGEIRGQIRRS